MRALRVRRAVRTAALVVSIAGSAAGAAGAQDRRQSAPGQFDYYVLALSWSPSYCQASEERGGRRRPDQQCAGRPFAFVVHGLWPQYDRGFPSYCQVPAPRLDRDTVGSVLDLMPSPRLVFHEWERHGTCSGLTPHAYFETVRKARAVVKIPSDYLSLAQPVTVSPAEVTDAFLKVNAGLARDDIAVACDKKRLTEVRICLTRAFDFRACPEVARRACRRDKLLMPAVRGSQKAGSAPTH